VGGGGGNLPWERLFRKGRGGVGGGGGCGILRPEKNGIPGRKRAFLVEKGDGKDLRSAARVGVGKETRLGSTSPGGIVGEGGNVDTKKEQVSLYMYSRRSPHLEGQGSSALVTRGVWMCELHFKSQGRGDEGKTIII